MTSLPIVFAHDGTSCDERNAIYGRWLYAIFGSPDDLKFCSLMTLLAHTARDGHVVFRRALDRLCSGQPDERTIATLGRKVGAD